MRVNEQDVCQKFHIRKNELNLRNLLGSTVPLANTTVLNTHESVLKTALIINILTKIKIL